MVCWYIAFVILQPISHENRSHDTLADRYALHVAPSSGELNDSNTHDSTIERGRTREIWILLSVTKISQNWANASSPRRLSSAALIIPAVHDLLIQRLSRFKVRFDNFALQLLRNKRQRSFIKVRILFIIINHLIRFRDCTIRIDKEILLPAKECRNIAVCNEFRL